MCGITGVGGIGVKAEPQWIRKMTDTLKHRGPDDEGYLAIHTAQRSVFHLIGNDSQVVDQSIEGFNRAADFFLGHRRLSILDPTPAGHQPMSSKDKCLWIVYNGEIYNYLELRDILRQFGHTFRTNTDTEVLLAAYEQWGENCLEKLDGMWSFVIYDRRKNHLFGARDRFGVKPLYYYQDSSYFAFASEIKSLITLPFIHKTLNPAAVFDFLAFAGLDFIEEGFFKGILELQPSHAFIYDLARGNLDKWKYYTLYYEEKWESFNERKSKEYIRDIRDLVCDAVRLRLRSDVPVGSALSGGIDSSSIVCIISRLIAEEDHLKTRTGDRQRVFTAGFPGDDADESPWAKRAAEHANARWYLTAPKPEEFLEDIRDIAYYQETPYGSPMVYAQYRVMRLARENGVKVLLDGQGADELFTGYTMYYSVFFYQLLKHLNFKTLFREMNGLTHAPLDRKSLIVQLLKQTRRSLLPYPLIRRYRMKQKGHYHLINKSFWERYNQRFDLIRVRDFNSLNTMLFEYFTRQKLGNLLKYEDRNSMRFSIESRTPFSDYLNLIEYVFKIPAVYKMHKGWSKYLLREAMKGILPDDIRLRTDKKGFFIPDAAWLFRLKDHLKEYLTDDMKEFADIIRVKEQLDRGLENCSYDDIQMVWNIIGVAVWRHVFGF
jgi:asparagine synthase (glutamine-hydrolysing)